MNAHVPLVAGGAVGFVVLVWLLMHATVPLVTVFDFASDGRPKLYAAFLAGLAGLGGLLLTFTLPPARSRGSAVGSPPRWEPSTPPPAPSTTASSASR